jgi:predicted phage terminase large subunit-like protein
MPGGRILHLGTRWHPQDLYGYILKNTPQIRSLIIPAITEDGRSAWEEAYTIDDLLQKKAEMGVPIFETQYQMNVTAMEGRIFSYDNFHFYDNAPGEMVKYQGVDLAISKKTQGDFFAHCTIGVTGEGKAYVLDISKGRYSFRQQSDYIVKKFFQHDSVRVGIEANAYQGAQVEDIQGRIGKRKAIPIYTMKDKVTRAMKLAAKCENGDILFHRSQMMLIEELIKMPNGEHEDLFDALDIAVTTATTGIRKRRAIEPGLM